ncbi:GNAT family N-acetyltransferase [Sporosalibacterium faouarense]|uniref:GNAT family N-acetyltransferase n=1 Tax=Sporosalibacterium faouarense TaxID=516123 RepID=UPI001A9C4582|nr:GNAT family N-acetyltransferase [Sporosalibacterium faouarense]
MQFLKFSEYDFNTERPLIVRIDRLKYSNGRGLFLICVELLELEYFDEFERVIKMGNTNVVIEKLKETDCQIISKGFKDQGWNKPVEQYKKYYLQQCYGEKVILVANYDGQFVGYLTIVWKSDYPLFNDRSISEIMDLNVLIKFRGKGIGAELMNEAEKIVKAKSNICGLRVGLLKDYGPAQNMYINRGYKFDNMGISYDNKYLDYMEKTIADDDLCLGMIKEL